MGQGEASRSGTPPHSAWRSLESHLGVQAFRPGGSPPFLQQRPQLHQGPVGDLGVLGDPAVCIAGRSVSARHREAA